MVRKRIYFASSIILIGLILLVVRLVQIQLLETESFSSRNINLIERSVEQRTQQLIIDEGRGEFLDRNGTPLTYTEKNVLILFPFLEKMDWPIEKVANIIHIPKEIIQTKIQQANGPFIFGSKEPFSLSEEQMNQINKLEIQGVFSLKRKFPNTEIPAEQLIGITGENEEKFHERYPDKVKGATQKIGITGLQKEFDEWLIAEQEAKLIYHVDARGGPLFGVDVKYLAPANPFYPLNIRTTIDRDIQTKLEEVVDTYNIQKGGALLLDIETSEVLANVSRPNVNNANPFSDHGTTNYMFKPLIPGSVFKTVVTAAAIESGVDEDRTFSCSENIYGDQAERNLGNLDLKGSVAASCNRTFADLSKEMVPENPNILEEYATKLGLIGDIAWTGDVYHYTDFKQFTLEQQRIFRSEEEKKDLNYVAQTGIGQREVRVTPLGVANMMATIARGGKPYQVSTVSAIEYQNGKEMIDFPKKSIEMEKTIAPYTAMKLQEYLREVVVGEQGTATYLQQAAYKIAGKTGTAETGQYITNSNGTEVQLYNKWFAGYFPFDNPKYALVIVNMDVTEYEGGIYPIFKDAANAVYNLNQN